MKRYKLINTPTQTIPQIIFSPEGQPYAVFLWYENDPEHAMGQRPVLILEPLIEDRADEK